MLLLDAIAEQRIAEAIERGEFDNLPGAGRPLDLEDDALIAEELRVAYRILRNASCVPQEIETRREIRNLGCLLAVVDGAERASVCQRLEALQWALSAARGREVDLRAEEFYFECMIGRMQGGDR